MIQPIEVVGISKSFQATPVLDHFSTIFLPGKIHCIMGKSGVGKTTLLKILMGLEEPDEGSVTKGIEISAVFQENRLVETISAAGNVKMVLPHSVPRSQVEQELGRVLPQESINRVASQLSGGMQRRVAIVRAMMKPSDVVLMDEPFTGLDMQTRKEMITYIKERQDGRTVLIVTHEPQDAQELDADICVLTSR